MAPAKPQKNVQIGELMVVAAECPNETLFASVGRARWVPRRLRHAAASRYAGCAPAPELTS
jgi:hypothetical protein